MPFQAYLFSRGCREVYSDNFFPICIKWKIFSDHVENFITSPWKTQAA